MLGAVLTHCSGILRFESCFSLGCLLSVIGKIRSDTLVGIDVLFWFQFDRICCSRWVKWPLWLFKCHESQWVEHYENTIISEAQFLLLLFMRVSQTLYFMSPDCGCINHIQANQDNIAIKINHWGNLLPCILCEITEDYIGLCPLTWFTDRLPLVIQIRLVNLTFSGWI